MYWRLEAMITAAEISITSIFLSGPIDSQQQVVLNHWTTEPFRPTAVQDSELHTSEAKEPNSILDECPNCEPKFSSGIF